MSALLRDAFIESPKEVRCVVSKVQDQGTSCCYVGDVKYTTHLVKEECAGSIGQCPNNVCNNGGCIRTNTEQIESITPHLRLR